jgi:LPXTG-motif cell wall-anchored protein
MKKNNLLLMGIGALVAVAAAIFLVRRNRTGNEDKPPKKAPQLDIENPGDQSEFTTAASASEMG